MNVAGFVKLVADAGVCVGLNGLWGTWKITLKGKLSVMQWMKSLTIKEIYFVVQPHE